MNNDQPPAMYKSNSSYEQSRQERFRVKTRCTYMMGIFGVKLGCKLGLCLDSLWAVFGLLVGQEVGVNVGHI
jgi:hypothetical protein